MLHLRHKFILPIAVALLMLLLSGCEIVDQNRVQDEDADTIPWNTRADWEDSVIGVPY